MADDGGAADRIERGVGRFVRRAFLLVASLVLIGAWVASSGWYRLAPGEAGVVLRLGVYERTETLAGFYDFVRSASIDWNGNDPIRTP